MEEEIRNCETFSLDYYLRHPYFSPHFELRDIHFYNDSSTITDDTTYTVTD